MNADNPITAALRDVVSQMGSDGTIWWDTMQQTDIELLNALVSARETLREHDATTAAGDTLPAVRISASALATAIRDHLQTNGYDEYLRRFLGNVEKVARME